MTAIPPATDFLRLFEVQWLPTVVPMSRCEVLFCLAYLEHGNATQAAHEAGYTSANGGGLRFMVCKLLAKPNVAGYIADAIEQYLDAEKITPARIAQALAFEAFADRTAIFDEAGEALDLRDWPQELRGLVLSLEIVETIDPPTGEKSTKVDKVKFLGIRGRQEGVGPMARPFRGKGDLA